MQRDGNVRFSVIVPVYNTARWLPRCLDSIQNQTFTDWECILSDDGSTDESGVICDEYAARRSRNISPVNIPADMYRVSLFIAWQVFFRASWL